MIDFLHQRHEGSLRDFLILLAEDRFVPTSQDFGRLADLLHAAPSTNEELVMALCRLPDPQLCTFCEAALRCEVPEATDLVEAVLMRRGLVGLLAFVEPIIEEDRNVLWLADLLAEVCDDDSTRILLRLLDHHSAGVRSRAAEGLRAHRSSVDPRGLVRSLAMPLVRELSRPDPFQAIRALQRLAEPALEPDFGRGCSRRAERVLINCVIHERRQNIRGDAIAALGDLGSRDAVRCLVEALHREDQGLHQEVVIALRQLDDTARVGVTRL
jgi:HEAT repeat protein